MSEPSLQTNSPTEPTEPSEPTGTTEVDTQLPEKAQDTVENGAMSDEDNDMALMSKAAYGDNEAKERLAKEGYAVDNVLSTSKNITFIRDGKAYVAYKGTNLTDVQDLYTDYQIAIGDAKTTRLFRQGLGVAKKAVEKYGRDNVTLTGHSLGSTIALYANSETGARVVGFAPGVGLSMVAESALEAAAASVFRRKINNNTKVYAVRRDPISFLAPMTNAQTVFLPQKANTNPHALANFINYQRYNRAENPRNTSRKKHDEEPFLAKL